MAGLTAGGPNVDVSLLYEVNGWSLRAPGWVDRILGFVGDRVGTLNALLVVVVLLVPAALVVPAAREQRAIDM